MRWVLLTAIALTPINAAIAQQPKSDPLFAQARAALAQKLKDPESARIEGLKRTNFANTKGAPTPAVCGTVNAKNSFGGYAGAVPFVFMPSMNDAFIVQADNQADLIVATAIYRRFCLNQPD